MGNGIVLPPVKEEEQVASAVFNEIEQVYNAGRRFSEWSEKERAVALHDYVRDNVKFGWTERFDDARPSYTFQRKLGHCNPQGELLVGLCRQAGLNARQHFVVIKKDILEGVLTPKAYGRLPKEIEHSFSEVEIDGKWVKTDSYILDNVTFQWAKEQLQQTGREVGFGAHARGVNQWDGENHAFSFSQFADSTMLIEDHGTTEYAALHYRKGKGYRHKIGPIQLSRLSRFLGARFERLLNEKLHSVVRSEEPSSAK